MPRFLRRIYNRYHKLGKKKGKNRVWRKPKGRDNKLRDKRRGYGPTVSVGYRQKSSERENVFVVNNTNDLLAVQKGQRAVIGNLGKKKMIEVIKVAQDKGIKFENVNLRKFLKETEKGKAKGEIKK